MNASTTLPTDGISFADPLIGLSVLLVDDDPIQLKLVKAHLLDAGFEVTTAMCASEAVDAAKEMPPDIVVSDVVMDELDGFGLCGVLRSEPALERIPILLITSHVSGQGDREMAFATGANGLVERSPDFESEFQAIKSILTAPLPANAADYCALESKVSRLAPQMARLLARSRSAEERYRTLFEDASDAISVLTPDGVLVETNRRWEELLQIPRQWMVGRHIREFAPPGHEDSNVQIYRNAIDEGTKMPPVPIVGADGKTMHMEFSNKVVTIAGEPAVLAIGRDVTESVEARRELAISEKRYRTLVEGIPDVVWSATLDGRVQFMSARVEQICGFTPQEIVEEGAGFWFDRVHPEHVDAVRMAWLGVAGGSYHAEYRWQHRDGHWIWIRAHASLRADRSGRMIAEGTFADVTSQKRLEEQLRVSQKMEAVGQLTGGIAHDFNNILGVVLGNAEFLLGDLPTDDPRRLDVESILDAGRRAAALTRQLLTFSRHQIVEHRDLDLSRVVRDVEQMLRRVIGEDIDLTTILGDGASIRGDAGQLEQVIMNLVVNARDAMPQGGKLAIETSTISVEEALGLGQTVVAPGEYVVLSVSDTGCGMDAETLQRMFEPFYTTKPLGKGTGLGLSTCYGIVKQCGGHIGVYSERDRGTTFRIYLPRTRASQNRVASKTSATISSYLGGETILLIEDNAQLRSVIERTLKSLGYHILEACNGEEALSLHAAHAGCVDLVLTDVVMPGAGGPDIVSQIQKHGGDPRVVYMSGYTEHAALRDRRLDTSLNFIQKPFSPTAIARKVRAVLDAPVS